MSIGTFGAFTQARLAIYAAQTGISVTGNNISNVNTAGYTRQRLNQVSLYTAGSDRYYAEGDVRTGQGALVKSISQIRSPYLDIRFREENAQVGYYNAQLEGLNAIKTALDEVGKGDASKQEGGFGVLGLDIAKLFSALEDLTDQTGHQEYDNTVKQTAKNLTDRLHAYAAKLEEIQQDTINDFKQDLTSVNNILLTIRSLNEEIRKSEIHGDPALELRDERNRQIDELSGLMDIDVTYSEEEIAPGLSVEKLTISLGNANPDKMVETDESLLIDGVYGAQLILVQVPQENPEYDETVMPYLDTTDPDNPVPTDDPAFEDTLNPDYQGKYLKSNGEWTDDASEAKKVDSPNYDIRISTLRNKIGELHYTVNKGAAEKVGATAATGRELDDGNGGTVPETVEDLFDGNTKAGSVSVTTEDVPEKGDTTITIYTKKTDKDGNVSYTKQEFQQIISKIVDLDDNDLGGELQAERELLTEQGEFTDLGVIADIDENAATKRGIPYYQNTLDLLARQFAQLFNDANQGYRMDPNGNYITTCTNDAGETIGKPISFDYTDPSSGETTTFFLNKDTKWEDIPADVIEQMQANLPDTDNDGTPDEPLTSIEDYLARGGGKDDEDNDIPVGIFDGCVLFSNGNNTDDTTNITASNITISKTWSTTPSLVRSFTCPDGDTEPASGQSDNLTHMGYLLNKQKWDYVPNTLENTGGASGEVMFTGTIFEMWNDIGSTLGQDQSSSTTMLDSAYQNALSIDTERDSVSSVDFNDEAMNLMMYSKSYNAACRLMTTIDSVLDKLINNTGVTT